MKKTNFTEEQVAFSLRQAAVGVTALPSAYSTG